MLPPLADALNLNKDYHKYPFRTSYFGHIIASSLSAVLRFRLVTGLLVWERGFHLNLYTEVVGNTNPAMKNSKMGIMKCNLEPNCKYGHPKYPTELPSSLRKQSCQHSNIIDEASDKVFVTICLTGL